MGKRERVFEHPLVEQESGTGLGAVKVLAMLGIVAVMAWRLISRDGSG